ncbi:hypothetical protein SDC9_206883 [bioreactor metagenome]|uniref:Uncharacterized protein n=1 Tax=bioreactor metagenome TaxID=1076179 RepID=A0A645JHT7_9ZZZZ
MLADGIELGTHQAVRANRYKVASVHDAGIVMRPDAFPMSDAGGTVLVSPGIPAIGIA